MTPIPSQRPQRPHSDGWKYLLFLAPGLLLLIVFFYIPSVSAILYSFFDWDGHQKIFVGLENFQEMARDPVLRDGFRNLAVYLICALIVGNVVPLVVAELIFNLRSERHRRFYQSAFLVTGLVPAIVGMLIWQFIFDPYMGPLNALLPVFGFDKMDILWLADPKLAIYCLILIGFPWVAGTSVLIILSGLNGIPGSILDYCRLEGISAFRRFFTLDIFFLAGQMRLLLITGFIGLMQAFGLQLILTQGGPGTSTMVPGYHMYINAFSYDRLGYASAIGLLIAIVILIFTLLTLRYFKPAR